jgi:hypothetical protein
MTTFVLKKEAEFIEEIHFTDLLRYIQPCAELPLT